MSHYANECWDLETYVNNDWLECIGITDRGNYDLTAHIQSTNTNLSARRQLDKPVKMKILEVKPDFKKIGPIFGELSGKIKEYFYNLEEKEVLILQSDLQDDEINLLNVPVDKNKYIAIPKNLVTVKETVKTKTCEYYVPHVLEPSFGIDRLLYSILEQNFWYREEDNQRIVLSLVNELLPYDVAIFPLSKK
jgi:glycyl-tRNA synthetase